MDEFKDSESLDTIEKKVSKLVDVLADAPITADVIREKSAKHNIHRYTHVSPDQELKSIEHIIIFGRP